MKHYILCLLLFISSVSFAQFHLSVLNDDVNNALAKVIEDYPNHFNASAELLLMKIYRQQIFQVR